MAQRIQVRGFALFLLLVFSVVCFAQEKEPVPLESILNSPDHADMPWKVRFTEPRLMYQQQYLVEVRSRIPAEILDTGNKSHVLHFVAKVQDSSGHWLPGMQYNRFEPLKKIGDTKDIECALGIYLKPGEYTIAMVAYDSSSNQSNLMRRKVVVPTLSGDPLPELNAHLPAADFPIDFPDQELARTDRSDGELFSIGHQLSPLPLPNKGNIRIDLILDISKQESPDANRLSTGPDRGFGRYDPRLSRRRSPYDPLADNKPDPRGLALGRVLQTASVLSRLAPINGCIFVAAVDPIRMKVALQPTPATSLDWPETQKKLEKFDQNMIDARVLQNKKGPGLFLHDLFEKATEPTSKCGADPVTTHYVVVVSPSLNLPEFSGEMRVSEVAAERARFYYFRSPGDNPYSDDLMKVLKSAKPRQFEFSTPEAFRKSLASFLNDVRSN